MTLKTLLAALLIVCVSGKAHADFRDLFNIRDVRNFKFTGRVTQSLPLAPQGSKVTGTFSYEVSTEPGYLIGQRFGPGYGNAAYQFPRTFTLKVNGHTLSSQNTFVDVFNNMGSNVEDMLNVTGGYPLVLDGTTLPDASAAISLATGPDRKFVLLSTDLPRWIFPKLFNGWAYGVVQQGGGPHDTLVTFSIDSIELLP